MLKNSAKAKQTKKLHNFFLFNNFYLAIINILTISITASGRGGIGRRNGLKQNLSAFRETGNVELLKVGEPCKMAIPSQASHKEEGVETRRAASKTLDFLIQRYDEGIVQTTNLP